MFFLGFIRSTDRQATNQPTTYSLTHRIPTQRLTESIIILERLDNRNIHFAEHKHNWENIQLYLGMLSKLLFGFHKTYTEELIIFIFLTFKH